MGNEWHKRGSLNCDAKFDFHDFIFEGYQPNRFHAQSLFIIIYAVAYVCDIQGNYALLWIKKCLFICMDLHPDILQSLHK